MSDFDREAEREKLREQFEADKRKREQSERMSELLLKGATMTNKHCDRCGDPVFRWDGQEFCPTCQGGPGGQPEAEQAQQGGQPQQGEPAAQAEGAETTPEPEQGREPQPTEAPERTGTPERAEPAAEPTPEPTTPARPERTGRADDDVTAARASLARTLSELAAQAESADDLAATREYLAAAKEAAEALDAAERL